MQFTEVIKSYVNLVSEEELKSLEKQMREVFTGSHLFGRWNDYDLTPEDVEWEHVLTEGDPDSTQTKIFTITSEDGDIDRIYIDESIEDDNSVTLYSAIC